MGAEGGEGKKREENGPLPSGHMNQGTYRRHPLLSHTTGSRELLCFANERGRLGLQRVPEEELWGAEKQEAFREYLTVRFCVTRST